MPRHKSRVPSRAPPKPPAAINETELTKRMKEERQEKLNTLLKEFDHEVEKRVEQMQMELEGVKQSVQQLHRAQMRRHPEDVKVMLWQDYEAMMMAKKVVPRDSIAHMISTTDSLLHTTAKKKGRKTPQKASSVDPFLCPLTTATRSMRNQQVKTVLGDSQADNMPPPPSTHRGKRGKKVLEVAATPMNQPIPACSMMVTPKFDPRMPLPQGTVKRRPRMGEVVMSLTGSPIQVSPVTQQPTNQAIEGLFANVMTLNMREKDRNELLEFRQKVERLVQSHSHQET